MENIKEISRANSAQLYEQSKSYFPGGVNSPVRAFRSVYGTPLFIKKGDGCHIIDEDDNQFIDFCGSWGPLILGHNHPAILEKVTQVMQHGMTFGAPTALENELAALIINNNRFVEKIRFTSSGTEAVMSAIRLARGYTQRDKIIKFEGCYHGHVDSLLVKAGSGLVTFGETSSAGVPSAYANETIVLPLNNQEALKEAFAQFKNQIAAVIIEGIPANNGLLIQSQEFIQFIRNITQENQSLLIFDEVITGFRVGFEGAAALYQIHPDIVTYGKIIGGGLPVGMYGASKEIMAHISPDGAVYQAGTLSGNPVAMAAGIAQLTELLKPSFYESMAAKTKIFVQSILEGIADFHFPVKIFQVGSIFWITFTDRESIQTADEINAENMQYFKKFYQQALNRGVYFGPSGYEVGFVSAAHTADILEDAKNIIVESLKATFL